MDFDTLFPILLLVFYFLLQLRSKKNKKKPAPPPAAPPPQATLPEPHYALETTAAPENELDLALREIRQALGMEAPATPPQPEPLPRPAPPPQRIDAEKALERPPLRKDPFKSAEKPIRKQTTYDDTFKSAEKPIRKQTTYDDSFKDKNRGPEYEHAFEAHDPFGQPFRPDEDLFDHPPAFQETTPRSTVPSIDSPPQRAARGTAFRKRLRNGKLAREAFILSEILGPPRSRKP